MLAENTIRSIRIDDVNALQSAYMPFLEHGGIFLPSEASLCTGKLAEPTYRLNDEMCLLVELFDEEPHCCIVRVAWISPVALASGPSAGLGLHFSRNDHRIKSSIESKLADGQADSVQPQTL